ncbi:hypothetical protein H4S04_007513 [Coemansia sp. S16]|nr:hypothetical protein GGI14_003026 [Coemansia sp. S680]KAJ2042029.1 hypothetical protein H4S04_007513 [Coemansia sp. S16]KAJ2080288.1 hypothetical protein GGI09_007781 [Coemansia sp. S100]KAJ2088301.1 hypothetical protein GGI16_006356 [Coemansia sp. S142-1]
MEHFNFPADDTYSLLARQGYAAQSRRRSSSRRMAHPFDADLAKNSEPRAPLGELNYSMSSISCGSHMKLATEGCVTPIDMPLCGDHSLHADSAYVSTSSYTSSSDSSTPVTPSSPRFRSLLHERYSTELQSMAIKEEDCEGGTVIHNGLKRLSMSEAKLVYLGRPRIVHM